MGGRVMKEAAAYGDAKSRAGNVFFVRFEEGNLGGLGAGDEIRLWRADGFVEFCPAALAEA